MKNIETILKEFGLEIPLDQAEAFRRQFHDNYKTVNEVKKIEDARDEWQHRAETAEGVLKGFGENVDPAQVLRDLEEARNKLASAEEDYNKKLAARDFDDALREAIGAFKFTSPAAQRDVERQIRESGLTVKDGKILGLSEFVAGLREKEPDSFVDEAAEKAEAGKARFTQRTTDNGKGKKPMTRDEIMAIPDRAARRTAIAENLDLFEKN